MYWYTIIFKDKTKVRIYAEHSNKAVKDAERIFGKEVSHIKYVWK